MDWDGTYVECTLVEVSKKNGINYGWIPEYNIDCLYIKRKNLLPVIIDEIKYVFGIRKIGTRYNKRYIFFPPNIQYNTWLEETRLSDINEKLSYSNIRQCRNILAFRYLLGLTNINERSILYRNGVLYDFNDINCHEFGEKISLSMRVMKDWFKEIDVNKTIFLMLKNKDIKNKVELILHVRIELTKVIEVIDKKHIDMVSTVCNRLIDIFDHVTTGY